MTTTERAYDVETIHTEERDITAATPLLAAQECADYQYSDDGARVVTLTWVGTGPDSAVAEYRAEWVETIGAESVERSARVVVRESRR